VVARSAGSALFLVASATIPHALRWLSGRPFAPDAVEAGVRAAGRGSHAAGLALCALAVLAAAALPAAAFYAACKPPPRGGALHRAAAAANPKRAGAWVD